VRKLTLVGDPHAMPKNLDKLTELFKLVEELGNDTIILGDLLDTKELVRGSCLNFWINYFNNSSLFHYVLVGNHDWFNLDCKEHSLSALKMIPNVELIDSPRIIYNKKVPSLYAAPYIHDKEEVKKVIAEAKKLNIPLVAHLEINSFDFGNGQICTTGLVKNDFKGVPLVISGHFHKQSIQDNIVYVGTPFTHSFGEANQKKQIAVLSEDLSLEYIDVKLPAHLSIELDVEKLTAPSISKLNKLAEKNYVRLIVTGSREKLTSYDFTLIDKSVKIIKKFNDIAITEERVNEELSNVGQFSYWASKIKNLDKETISLGIKLLSGE